MYCQSEFSWLRRSSPPHATECLLCSGCALFSVPCPAVSSQGYRVWWMQDYQFRDPVVIVKCQAYTGAVAATVTDQGVCGGGMAGCVCVDSRGYFIPFLDHLVFAIKFD